MDNLLYKQTPDDNTIRLSKIDEIYIQKNNDIFLGGSINNFRNIKYFINIFNFYDVTSKCTMFIENNKRRFKYELFFKLKNKKIKNKNFNYIKNILSNNLLFKYENFYYYIHNIIMIGGCEFFTIETIIDKGEIFLVDDINLKYKK